MAVDFDRLVDRAAIAGEVLDVAERAQYAAELDAAYLAAPRVTLVDEQRRLVRVVNVPPEARRDPPAVLSAGTVDPMTQQHRVEPVGRHRPTDNPLDLDYALPLTAAGDDLIAHLRDGIEPSVQLRRWPGGRADLLTVWD